MSELYYQYWGKCHQSSDSDSYHLLTYHNLDVAACGYQIVKQNYFNSAELFEQIGFSQEDNEKSALWFAYFLSWHDIGKFANGFQQLFKHNNPMLVAADPTKQYTTRHDSLGFWLWNEFLRNKTEILLDNHNRDITLFFDIWLPIMTGHHGKPPLISANGNSSFNKQDKQASLEYINAINQLFIIDNKLNHYPSYFFDKTIRNRLKQTSWLIAALTVISDWLGSNKQFFPFCSNAMPLTQYWQNHAIIQAEKAVASLPKSSPIAPFTSIKTLFPFIEKPTPLQQQAFSCQLSDHGAELFIMEDVTGAGKTEASMILAHKLMSAKKAQGIYIGLPTQATANAIYQRMASVYGQLYQPDSHPSLVLSHGNSDMNPNFTDSILNRDENSEQHYPKGEQTISAECNEWFVDTRKKSLLAEVGVGTLDQTLMAVMPFKHQSLRLLGLRHKLLILDEVHAYDSYMVKLLEVLLHYHALQGGSAIILTATLPYFLREKLLNAFYRGLTNNKQSIMLNPTLPFPLMTQLNHQGLTEQAIATREEVKRQVNIDWISNTDAGISKIHQALAQGKIICWIKNSVSDAITLYQQLQLELNLDTNAILLFHSRFAYCDRIEIEQKTLQWAGKTSNHQIRSGKVIIATQVIEQSLDLDFDEMISDIAPIDLLIQRAGRLQRHIRDSQGNIKPFNKTKLEDDRDKPTLTILAPTWQEEPNKDWLDDAPFRNTSYVYSDHAYLWFTQNILRKQKVIKMPEDARLLIESVYSEDKIPPTGLQEVHDKATGRKYSESSIAKQSVLKFNDGYSRGNLSQEWDKEVELSTRLTEPSVNLYLAYKEQDKIIPYCTNSDKYAWEQSRIGISLKKWEKIKKDIPQLDQQSLAKLRQQIHRPTAIIVLMNKDKDSSFYSKTLGFYAY
jgi:CRISPR-associated endonuclease/helicase Cas3